VIIRPRRSVLYVPALNARAIAKSRTLPVDAIIFDLKESVAPEKKALARTQVVDAIIAGGFGVRELIVRINALDNEWWLDDVNAAATVKPDAILVPKVSSPQQLQDVAERLIDISAEHKIRIWAMMETPLSILYAREIAAASIDVETRLDCLVMGINDLAKETRAKITAGREPMRLWLMNCVAAARAYGLDVLDGVHNDFQDVEGLARQCAEARDMGFDGKTIIHPRQIDTCNAVFAPTAEEVAQARTIISAFEQPQNAGKGVIALDGRLIERRHEQMARRTLAIAEAIAAAA
jgi:citrate lyase subunit beta/citryl-CoA lyase